LARAACGQHRHAGRPLYAPADHRRDQAYLLFNLGINLGAFAGPLVCGLLGEQGNWHIGFAMAGVGMLVGLVIYVTGWRHLPPTHDQPPSLQSPIGQPGASACCWRWWRSAFYNIPVGQGYNVFPCGSMLPPTAIWGLHHPGLVVSGQRRSGDSAGLASCGDAVEASDPRGPCPASRVSAWVARRWRRRMGCWPPMLIFGRPHGLGPLRALPISCWPPRPISMSCRCCSPLSRAAPPRLTATMMGTAYAGLFLPISPAAGWRAFTNPGARNASGLSRRDRRYRRHRGRV
jgi:POT family proton-dependent oligopeptide transporter